MGEGSKYVSITGLRLNHWRHWPRFAWHASRSMKQARAAEGCLSAEARSIGGMFYTVGLWQGADAFFTCRPQAARTGICGSQAGLKPGFVILAL